MQTFKGEGEERINTFTISPDGRTLTLNVAVTSRRLPKPLVYKLVYGRVKFDLLRARVLYSAK